MQPSVVNTMSVPSAGSGEPTLVFVAGQIPMRVNVSNVGAVSVQLAHESSTLTNSPPTLGKTFILPIGREVVFVLAPGQAIVAVSQGAGGEISIAASEAIPQTAFGA